MLDSFLKWPSGFWSLPVPGTAAASALPSAINDTTTLWRILRSVLCRASTVLNRLKVESIETVNDAMREKLRTTMVLTEWE